MLSDVRLSDETKMVVINQKSTYTIYATTYNNLFVNTIATKFQQLTLYFPALCNTVELI